MFIVLFLTYLANTNVGISDATQIPSSPSNNAANFKYRFTPYDPKEPRGYGEVSFIESTFHDHGFVETTDEEYNILWTSWPQTPYKHHTSKSKQHALHNHCQTFLPAGQKCTLANYLIWLESNPGFEKLQITKESFFAEQNPTRMHQIMAANNESWIAKVCNAGVSDGIEIFFPDSPHWVDWDMSNKVMQRYITEPMLLEGRKWHWRIYVICTSWSPIRCYFAKDLGFAHRAKKPFEVKAGEPDQEHKVVKFEKQIFDSDIHLTFPTDDQLGFTESIDIIRQIKGKEATDKMIEDLYRKYTALFSNWNAYSHSPKWPKFGSWYVPLKNCYDLFGVDVMIEENPITGEIEPIILEANQAPDLTFQHPKTTTCMKVIYEAKMPLVKNIVEMIIDKVTIGTQPASSNSSFMQTFDKFWNCYCPSECESNPKGFPNFCVTSGEAALELIWQFEVERDALSDHFDAVVPPIYDSHRQFILEKGWKIDIQHQWSQWQLNGQKCVVSQFIDRH